MGNLHKFDLHFIDMWQKSWDRGLCACLAMQVLSIMVVDGISLPKFPWSTDSQVGIRASNTDKDNAIDSLISKMTIDDLGSYTSYFQKCTYSQQEKS